MSRLYLLGFYIALLTPALAQQCHPADYSIPATAHNNKVAKLTDRAKRDYTITILSHRPNRYILVKRPDGKTYRYYLSSSKGSTQAYTNGRYIILYSNNHYYIKRQPSPYTTRLICID